ncbi:MAG: DUF4062 domain-containing protein [Nitrospira sp.]|nr:DUF4062 domain-containing protein [Nitrospira sp.]MDH4244425.1 DUF4062 domain-containing protein [Nitrospira sp.]MDH4357149.1 DUF4062 domain-containing protein [Nitrospira sp.]MDH5319409.1 DUF4062 domain-containing protein [Nitrospira sp.]
MDRPRLFLSAVSEELRTARQAVARTVRTLGFDPVSQDDFPTGYGELRQWLREQLDSCEGLIQLVGQGYGAEPLEIDPAYGRLSYTQLEFLYARHKGKRTWVIVIGKDFELDKPIDQLDLPRDAGYADPVGYQAERRTLQQNYLAQLKRENHLRHTANNNEQLENIVLKLRDELGELREEGRRKERRLAKLIFAILLGVVLLGGGGWWAYQSLHDEVHHVGEVSTEKIRAHLLQTVEETHRRELAEGEAAPDWKKRQELRDAAENAHRVRLSRIEELAASIAEIEGKGTATSVFQEMTRILTEQGVDEAIAYVSPQRPNILQIARARVATAREHNHADLQPILRTAALYQAKGQANEARSLYKDILAVEPDWPEAMHALFRFLTDQGDLARIRTTLADAIQDYSEAHRLAKQLVAGDPSNTEWQRDLSISHNKIGDVLVRQGGLPAALTSYRASLAIAKTLATRVPGNNEWQRDLSVSHEKIGDVLVAQRELPEALTAYRASLAIRETLAKRDPGNSQWQRDLSVSHDRIGDVLVAQRELPEALTAYRASHVIFETLAKRDGGNSEWQRDLSISHNKIGDVLVAQGLYTKATEAYGVGLAIAKRLVVGDSSNTQWQLDLSEFYRELGDLAKKQNSPADARAYWKQAFELLSSIDQRGLHLSPEDRQFLETLRVKVHTDTQ